MSREYVYLDGIAQVFIFGVAAWPIFYDWLAEKFV
jgi:hypothetical protein